MFVNALIFFFIGVAATYGLIRLKENGKYVVALIASVVLYIASVIGFSMEPVDWRVSLSNSVSFAVLYFLPVLSVQFMHRIPSSAIKAKYLVMLVGSLTPNIFMLPGLGLAFVLGVG